MKKREGGNSVKQKNERGEGKKTITKSSLRHTKKHPKGGEKEEAGQGGKEKSGRSEEIKRKSNGNLKRVRERGGRH